MTIKITVRDLFDKGIRDEYCEMKWINPYLVNEWLIDYSDEVELNEKEFKKLI